MNNYTNRHFSTSTLFAFALAFALVLSILQPLPVKAQTPTLPEYIVVSGDNLSTIAARFKTTVAAIQEANAMNGSTGLRPGDHLKIPGLEGLSGIMVSDYVPLGASLTVLARRGQSTVLGLIKLNKITSPSELFVGREITITKNPETQTVASIPPILTGVSMLELAIENNSNYYRLARINTLASPNLALPMDTYYAPSEIQTTNSLAIPGLEDITLGNMPFMQGQAYTIRVKTSQALQVHSELRDLRPEFFKLDEHEQIAYGGINALAEPGIYPLTMEFTTSSNQTYRIIQYVFVKDGSYAMDSNITVDPKTLEEEANSDEDKVFNQIISKPTPLQQWQGLWQSPTKEPICITDKFGNRRTYNGDTSKLYFHTGLDLGYCMGIDVFAPASGTVVAVKPDQIIRGNAIVIDHGMGIFTTYMHLSKILISEGDKVEPGQKIGEIGNTGRSAGPHLHFQVDANGVHVNPETWLLKVFP
ncbi:MAG: peptidoglycan DD-metalloendopeptidase family protein [Anaerolineaceae bacterium]|nr:peptidoglycan DD-metalloendopeptidase family protein [Anaerolineaceae bacterium]